MEKLTEILEKTGMSFIEYEAVKVITQLAEQLGAESEVESLLIHLINTSYDNGWNKALDKAEEITQKNSKLY